MTAQPLDPAQPPDHREREPLAPTAVPRLLAADITTGVAVPADVRPSTLLDLVEASGLTGRGGAAFPVHRKMRAVAAAAGPRVVVANGAEGEPASAKDKTLLWRAPHLVLDGLQVAARAVGADSAYLYVHRHRELVAALEAAVAHRRRSGLDRVPVHVVPAPRRFISGEESALASRVSGRAALPRSTPPRVFERGVHDRPTLVQNVETLAHVGLIARYGAGWFRALGPAEQPGTMLFTVSGAVGAPGVVEAPVGITLERLAAAAGGTTQPVQAVLLGGYHGTWAPAADVWSLPLDNATLRPHGWAIGAGVVVLLPASVCGLAECARVAGYLAAESAGQCGPCAFGLPALAQQLDRLARPGRTAKVASEVGRLAALAEGRGACRHPDGSVRFVRTALTTFAAEVRAHDGGRCTATDRRPVLPVPAVAADERR